MFTEQELRDIINRYNELSLSHQYYYEDCHNSLEKRIHGTYAAGYTAAQVMEAMEALRADMYGGGDLSCSIYDAVKKSTVKAALDGQPQPQPEPQPQPQPTEAQEAQPTGGALEQAIVTMMKPYIDMTLKQQVQEAAARGAIETPLTLVTPTCKVDASNKHEAFKDILTAVYNHITLYLYGPAGSGKNVICSQVADALGLKFYYTNSVTQEYKITGYMDAYGHYQSTPFYDAFKNGGLFMLDELDASIPETLVILNAALANGYFTFPNNEYVKAHKDFHCIAAGNTLGHGADATYTGRYHIDGATLNRFCPRLIDYSRKIENMLADSEIVDFCRDVRKACKACGIEHVTSYRNIIALGQLAQIWDIKEAVKSGVIRELSDDDLNMIKDKLDTTNKYAACLY